MLWCWFVPSHAVAGQAVSRAVCWLVEKHVMAHVGHWGLTAMKSE